MEITDLLSREHRKEMKRQYPADSYLYMDTIADSSGKITCWNTGIRQYRSKITRNC
jgi:hypothetical protein